MELRQAKDQRQRKPPSRPAGGSTAIEIE